jgi:hypothetical protein
MIVSSAVAALRGPPETGASTIATPRSRSRVASRLVARGAEDPMSMSKAPGRSRPARPAGSPGPPSTRSTIVLSGSMRITTSAPAPSAGLVNAVTPSFRAAASTASGSMS